ncbi:MAG: T9SS type A sorting domain-containing protein, partial [Thiohalospira sp.]
SSTNDVARKLRTEASVVENFLPYNYTPPLSVYISGPTKGYNSGTYTWSANVSNGDSPYSYVWHYSLDGYNYTGTLGTSSIITAPLPLDNDLFLRVTVTSSDGQTAVDYHTTINLDAGFGDPIDPKDPMLKSVTDSIGNVETNAYVTDNFEAKEEVLDFEIPIQISVYPNPITDFSTVSYFVNSEAKVSLNILDANGRIVKNLVNGKQDKGQYNININVQDLTSGIYFCQLVSGNKKITKKIIIK